jgi:uncharacterized protein YbjT (DUF2867 family)
VSDPIFISGATGNVGAAVVKLLSAQGVAVRAATSRPVTSQSSGTATTAATVQPVHFDFLKPETFAPALTGVKRMFLVRPPRLANVKTEIAPAIDAAQALGVEQIIFLSIINVEQNQQVPHYKIEQYLQNSGVAYTFLRASFFMQNFDTTHRAEIRDRSEIFVPVGDAKTSFIDVRDIAAVAALTLTAAGHANQAYELTGGAALDYYEVAEIFSNVLGRTITHCNPSALNFLWQTVRRGTPLPYAAIMTWLYTSTRSGMGARVTNTAAELLARPPITLRQYVQDYKEKWQE